MRVTVKVGEVAVTIDGLDYTRRQVVSLLEQVASVALALPEQPEPDKTPLGFTAHLERAIEEPPEGYYEDEE